MKNYIITLQCNPLPVKCTYAGVPAAFLLCVRAGFCWAAESLGSWLKSLKRIPQSGSMSFGNMSQSVGFRSELYSGCLSTSQSYSGKTVVTNVAICGQLLLWRTTAWPSICECICQTLDLKILRRKCTYTCWSTVQPYGSVYVAITLV